MASTCALAVKGAYAEAEPLRYLTALAEMLIGQMRKPVVANLLEQARSRAMDLEQKACSRATVLAMARLDRCGVWGWSYRP